MSSSMKYGQYEGIFDRDSATGVMNALAILYILVSAAPAFYIPPVVLFLMIFIKFLDVSGQIAAGRHVFSFSPPPYVFYLFILIFYMVLNGLVSGLSIFDIFSYNAIRYDANIIYSAIPLFLLGAGWMELKNLDFYIKNISIFASIFYIFSLVSGVQLFESHNAAGGYFMALLGFLVGRGMVSGFNGRIFSIFFVGIALYFSDSRGSILAVLAIVSLMFLAKRSPNLTKLLLFLLSISVLFVMSVFYKIWLDYGAIYLWDYSLFSDVSENINLDNYEFGARPGTIIHRILFLYPMAIDLFLHSPFFGIGFTRFDDFPISMQGEAWLAQFNTTGFIQHTNLHAHNTYLHILAECGIIGFFLLYLFIKVMLSCFKGCRETMVPVQVMFGALLFASMTEHRLTSPSQAAPIFMMIGLLWACRRTEMQVASTEK